MLYIYKHQFYIIKLLRHALTVDWWVCEVSAKLTQYISENNDF